VDERDVVRRTREGERGGKKVTRVVKNGPYSPKELRKRKSSQKGVLR